MWLKPSQGFVTGCLAVSLRPSALLLVAARLNITGSGLSRALTSGSASGFSKPLCAAGGMAVLRGSEDTHTALPQRPARCRHAARDWGRIRPAALCWALRAGRPASAILRGARGAEGGGSVVPQNRSEPAAAGWAPHCAVLCRAAPGAGFPPGRWKWRLWAWGSEGRLASRGCAPGPAAAGGWLLALQTRPPEALAQPCDRTPAQWGGWDAVEKKTNILKHPLKFFLCNKILKHVHIVVFECGFACCQRTVDILLQLIPPPPSGPNNNC